MQGINPMVWMVDVLRKINKHPAAKIQDLYRTNGKDCRKPNLCCSVSLLPHK
ncbi:hypothetical protein [Pedobacter westerhofensis]|uniref:hypothetical protein n=1 Tax=Pedobacter westerhofensis TaxID=425512 RepID=UPI0037428146